MKVMSGCRLGYEKEEIEQIVHTHGTSMKKRIGWITNLACGWRWTMKIKSEQDMVIFYIIKVR